ncbi:MAG: DUF4416 family protein [Chitinivibrionales bacterium]|nr:DUF4416 family protein [Chitinivibrionales bacterium]
MYYSSLQVACRNIRKYEGSRTVGKAKEPQKAKLFLAITWSKSADRDRLWKQLGKKWGTPDFSHGPVPFDFTDYYRREMGAGLEKQYVTFPGTVDRGLLPGIKCYTNTVESRFLRSLKRTVNLDPGLLTKDKLVLASTKDFFHRIYLAKSIYAEVTLHFRKGKYRYFSWTYPDYREPPFQAFLCKSRARLIQELKQTEREK